MHKTLLTKVRGRFYWPGLGTMNNGVDSARIVLKLSLLHHLPVVHSAKCCWVSHIWRECFGSLWPIASHQAWKYLLSVTTSHGG